MFRAHPASHRALHACLHDQALSPPLLNRFPEHALAVDKIETGSRYPNFETIDIELYQALADLVTSRHDDCRQP